MRFRGHNVLAIVLAAGVIYLIEFLIFRVLIPDSRYQHLVGLSPVQVMRFMRHLPYGAVMPFVAAIGLSLVIKWRQAIGPLAGAATAAIIAIVFALPVTMYQYVYGAATETWLLISLVHFVVAYGAAGAVLGAWK